MSFRKIFIQKKTLLIAFLVTIVSFAQAQTFTVATYKPSF